MRGCKDTRVISDCRAVFHLDSGCFLLYRAVLHLEECALEDERVAGLPYESQPVLALRGSVVSLLPSLVGWLLKNLGPGHPGRPLGDLGTLERGLYKYEVFLCWKFKLDSAGARNRRNLRMSNTCFPYVF